MVLVALCSLGLGVPAWSWGADTSPARRLQNPKVGYSLVYPAGWRVTGRVQGTAFSAGADCRSVRVIDFKPPDSAGPGGKVLQSFVQTCSKRLSDGLSLESFMRKTYGSRLPALFESGKFAGVDAYRAGDEGSGKTIFLQTDKHRLEVVAAVVASPAKSAERLAQMKRILASFSLTR
jgi:hypothetical protein